MTAKQLLTELEAAGTAQNRKVYQRHGVKPPLFGVSYGNLEKLRKRVKRDHPLAVALWESGNHDARILATKIADPKQADRALLEGWAVDLDNYVLTDAFAQLAAASDVATEITATWIDSPDEWVSSAGWTIIAIQAKPFEERIGAFLDRIETTIHSAPNRTRHSMNNALIAIGLVGEPWTEKAVAAAERIGKVEVDHGVTSCTTPEAVAYIRKSLRRKC